MSNKDIEIKKKFDTAFDEMFFSKEFKEAVTGKFGICPDGLTFDTDYNEDSTDTKLCLYICCKKYGYDYPEKDHVIGDYYLLDNSKNIPKDIAQFMVDWVKEKNPEIFHELCKIDPDIIR